ncbi:hypothetical protein ACFP3Q_01010 [Nocardioides sp. GCM10027113]|uniref:hypothetical protein n=1 Tax=unclassified Nocardioides TaxID=2615069 RepID=UPI00360C5FDD
MAGEVHASFSGMTQLADLCRDQEVHLRRVEDLVHGPCANVGAFSGFMALFASAYQDAQATVAEEIGAHWSADEVRDEIVGDARAEIDRLERDDAEMSDRYRRHASLRRGEKIVEWSP